MFKKVLRNQSKNHQVPEYIKQYNWAYINPYLSYIWDHQFCVNALLLNQYHSLKKEYLKEMNKDDRVLQMGSTYWDICPSLAKKTEQLIVIDVLQNQVETLNKKLINQINSKCILGDAADIELNKQIIKNYDINVLSSFFLFHEIPLNYKQKVLNNMLQQGQNKLVFIDYHKPNNDILLNLQRKYFKIFEPFAQEFVNKELWQFADENLIKEYTWKKELYYDGLYQKVVALKN